MGFKCLVRDQEVEGSNPFAPTTSLESATYKMRKSIERLVAGLRCRWLKSILPQPLFVLSNQCVTQRSRLRGSTSFYGQHIRLRCSVSVLANCYFAERGTKRKKEVKVRSREKQAISSRLTASKEFDRQLLPPER